MERDLPSSTAGEEKAGPPDARITETAAWLGQFWRTLKTCRLYGPQNANAINFRTQLAKSLSAMLEKHGSFKLQFTAHEVACDGYVLVKAQTREDNVAMPFYRDGLRTLTFHPGMEPAELDTLLDLLLRVTSRASDGTDDLVTLLWDCDLPHLDMSYVSSETDADLGDESDDPLAELLGTKPIELIPWPGGSPGDYAPSPASGTAGTTSGSGGSSADAGATEADKVLANDVGAKLRSEDWVAGEPAHDLEERYRVIDADHGAEVERFHALARAEREATLATATVELVRDAMNTELREGDSVELVDLLARGLQEAIADAAWELAHQAVDHLIEYAEGQWDPAPVFDALARPDSPVTAALVRQLDGGVIADTQRFAEFARSLGPATIEWLMSIVASSAQQRTRRLLVRTLGELCEGNPERLAPWLADERWYVVRNAVLVVGSAEGSVPVGLLRPLVHHPEPRVRQEVVRALANASPGDARPLLLELLKDSEPPIRNSALHQIGGHRHPDASAALLALLGATDFHKRPIDDVRPIIAALGGCAGDEALPALEAQLHAPGWLDKNAGPYRQMVARCIARIGTPAAQELLEQGSKSRTAAVREACQLVMKGTARG